MDFRPLAGARVVDLTSSLAGPYCTQVLAGLGADVVKVEHPQRGDEARAWGPEFADGASVLFFAANRVIFDRLRIPTLSVAEERQVLFLDCLEVAEASGLEFVLNEMSKHPANPVLTPGPPGSKDDRHVQGGSFSKHGSTYVMRYGYQSWDQQPDEPDGAEFKRGGLAISPDGVRWQRVDKLPEDLVTLGEKTAAVLRQLASADRETAEPALTYLQAQLYRDFVSKFYSVQRNLNPRVVTIEDVPEELRRKFVGSNGDFLLQIHPKVDIWEREGARQFVTELRSVDPAVTGSPVITYEATRLMERGYLQGTVYAFILVGGLTLLMIRRLKESALALLPLALGLLWTIGLMHLFGLKFNLANVWGLPLMIGISAEFGLNVVLRYLEGRAHGGPLVARSTVMGVVLNGVTTIVGFGSLMIAAHRGIFGLGLLLTIGSACGLVAALVVLPVILRLVTHTAPAAAAGESLSRSSAA